MIYGGIEGGGTKWVCAVGNGPDDLQAIVTVPTTTPVETIDRVAAFFALHPETVAVGVGSFGPLDLDQRSPHFGAITTTPKPGWAGNSKVLATWTLYFKDWGRASRAPASSASA